MTKSYVMIDVNDPRMADLADVISNKTCKKILNLLAEREMNESEIAKEIDAPLNTVNYNMKKISSAGLVEKIDKVLWSEKGKRINLYKLSNKKIVISPKESFRGILSALGITALAAVGIKIFSSTSGNVDSVGVERYAVDSGAAESSGFAAEKSVAIVSDSMPSVAGTLTDSFVNLSYSWAWFFLGALIALLVLMILNWRKS